MGEEAVVTRQGEGERPRDGCPEEKRPVIGRGGGTGTCEIVGNDRNSNKTLKAERSGPPHHML